jgi:hypothetical protein
MRYDLPVKAREEDALSESASDRHIGHAISASPASAVRKSIAHLHHSAVAREKRLNLLFKEQTKARQQLNAPILKVVRPSLDSKVAKAALDAFQTTVMDGHDGPAVPTDENPEVQWAAIGGQSVGVVASPFAHHFTQPDTSNRPDGNVSDSEGNMIIAVAPTSGGMTAIGGIGFEFVPTPDMTMVSVRSYLSYNYCWSTIGNWPFDAHSEGNLGLLVHRFDPNENVAEEFNFPAPLWDVTSDGASGTDQGSTTLLSYLPTLAVGGKYIIWSYARVYCNSTDVLTGSSRGIAWLRMKCNLMTIQSIFIR